FRDAFCAEEKLIAERLGIDAYSLLEDMASRVPPGAHGVMPIFYAVFMAGASIQWLRDEMKLISDAFDSEYFATKVKDTNGVYVVP
ncbi:hypothetical protein MJM43_30040, partial [Salmonella enterica subsp. enterica serovar Montevideo]|nr:hypothetical protein [Salmonella enterica subsp. enterica serovar Montevideo]